MADLFQIQIFAADHTSQIVLQYDKGENASNSYEYIRSLLNSSMGDSAVEVTDDFGMKLTITRAWVGVVLMTHVNRQVDGQRAGQLLGQRANAQLQQDIASDPVLKLYQARPGFAGNPQMQRG